jgi:hypothetical protein
MSRTVSIIVPRADDIVHRDAAANCAMCKRRGTWAWIAQVGSGSAYLGRRDGDDLEHLQRQTAVKRD